MNGRKQLEFHLFNLINKHSDLEDVIEMLSNTELIRLIEDFKDRNKIFEE